MKPDEHRNEPKYGYYRHSFASENEMRYNAELRQRRLMQKYKDNIIKCVLILSIVVFIILLFKFDT